MAITSTWSINENEIKRSISDDYVIELGFRVDGKDDTTNTSFSTTSKVLFSKPDVLPSDFIPFESITRETAVSWIKDNLGTKEVSIIESNVSAAITLIDNPTEKLGAPTSWS
tara:strand:- start:45 stop:380 length:336 start_codon:yes stop_codon:yes gene_type:complete